MFRMKDLHSLVPQTKHNTEKAAALVALGYPAVAPVLPQLLEWMQDYNWPVAQVLKPLLAGIGRPLVPHIRAVLHGNDAVWKYWLQTQIAAESRDVYLALMPQLERLRDHPSEEDRREELDAVAGELLDRHRPD